MSKIVYVRLRPFGKVYRYFTNIEEIQKGDKVVVEGDFGLTIGSVLAIFQDNIDSLKPVIRIATDEDIENFEKNLII
jgi:cell fate regulator YaaT (PSP1 superfamily)